MEAKANPEGSEADRSFKIVVPFPGLRPFAESEQRLFFGRDQQVKDILSRLENTYFAFVIGGSGSGKSSIVNAGVIPALRKKQIRARGDFWLTATFSPKDRPFRNLATALAELLEPLESQTFEQLINEVEQTLLETNSLAGFLGRYRQRIRLEEGQAPESRESANLLIFCDQFEEIFRAQNRDNPETAQLVNLIVEAYKNRDAYPQLYIMIGMRSEDLHRCAAFIDLPQVVNASSFLTRRLNEEEMASAIIEPMRLSLRLRGVKPRRFEPIEVDSWPLAADLLGRLNKATRALAHDPDHLPLLQHLLSVLWRHLEKNGILPDQGETPEQYENFRITSDHLAQALGFKDMAAAEEDVRRRNNEQTSKKQLDDSWILERALDRAAEQVMPKGKLEKTTEMMFRLLAERDDRGNYKRRWTTRKEVHEVTGASSSDIEDIITAFTADYPFLYAREGWEAKIDVSHEAFIRNWEKFQDWLKKERSLAIAYVALRQRYLERQKRIDDPKASALSRLSAKLSYHLNRDQLFEMRDWWDTRSPNLAWAARYAKGVDDEETERERERRENTAANAELAPRLNAYYRRSKLINLGLMWSPILALMLFVVPGILALEGCSQAERYGRELAALTPQQKARAITSVSDKGGFLGERRDRERIYEAVVSLAMLQNMKETPPGWLIGPYQKLRYGGDALGRNFYFASQEADVAARAALDTTIWPQPPSTLLADGAIRRPAEGRLLPRDCLDQLSSQSYLQQLSMSEQIKAEDIAHTLAPLEPPDGRRIAIVRSSDFGRLYFLVLTPGSECKLDPVFAMGFPPGGKVEFDPDLRLIVINGVEQGSWVYRINWIRQCRKYNDQAKRCEDVKFAVETSGPVIYSAYAPLEARGATLLVNPKTKDSFRLHVDHKPVLVMGPELATAKELLVDRSGRPQQNTADVHGTNITDCESRGNYTATLEANLPNSPEQVPAANVRVELLREGMPRDRAECGSSTAPFTLNLKLPNYTLRRIALSENAAADPEFLYLQSTDPDVVYRVALSPAKLQTMLCEALYYLYDRNIPDAPKPPSQEPEARYYPARLCENSHPEADPAGRN